MTSVNISLVVAGMAALGGLEGLDPVFVVLPALPLAAIWFFSIRYFRRLSKAKWEVVHEIESQFQHQPFIDEWKKVKDAPDWIPFGLTHLEMFVPLAIIATSTLYLVFRIQQAIV
ncbi:MAG: hypothetical protein GC150_11030 [Rhizobiales bacterium]|nr:hypothetical protein [Hyphomicrobiales bacterium]